MRLQGHVLSRIRSEGSGDRKILQAEVEAGPAVWSVDFPFPFFSHLSDSYAFPLPVTPGDESSSIFRGAV